MSTSSTSAGSADDRIAELSALTRVARQPFGEVSPRKAWPAACLAAAETLELNDMWQLLEIYAGHALVVEHCGAEGYRELMARAEERLRTGAEPTGGVSGGQMKAMIAERLRNRE